MLLELLLSARNIGVVVDYIHDEFLNPSPFSSGSKAHGTVNIAKTPLPEPTLAVPCYFVQWSIPAGRLFEFSSVKTLHSKTRPR